MPLLSFYAFFIGACIGSFLNVVAERTAAGESFVKGRSHCPHCGAVLGPTQLIPIVSYVFLRGKCRNCKTKISMRYPLTEAACGVLFTLCFWRFGFHVATLTAMLLTSLLFLVFLIDLDTLTIPNGLVLLLLLPLGLELWQTGFSDLLGRLIGAAAISVPMLIFMFIIPDCFGGGDVKLMAVCGFLLSWQGILLAFFVGVVSCGAVSAIRLAAKKVGRGDHVAFGPYLSAGIFISYLYGPSLIGWYLHLMGF